MDAPTTHGNEERGSLLDKLHVVLTQALIEVSPQEAGQSRLSGHLELENCNDSSKELYCKMVRVTAKIYRSMLSTNCNIETMIEYKQLPQCIGRILFWNESNSTNQLAHLRQLKLEKVCMMAYADLVEVANEQDDDDYKEQILALFVDGGELTWVRKRYDFNGLWFTGESDTTGARQIKSEVRLAVLEFLYQLAKLAEND